ncbi:MAG: Ig-like domain-containing protein [Gemmatimonadaceae bacterium]|jgi:hypothetical protein|nr:Ig-like domain-containing protein [Gemmatimonadaceae bacterium]
MRWTVCGVIASVALLAACAGESPATVETRTRFRLDPAALDLFVGQDSALRALSTMPGAASTFPILWRSADPSIATVSADGRVRAVAPGVTQVMAASRTDTSVAQVRVLAAPCVLLLVFSPAQVSIAPGQRLDVPVTMQTCGIRTATGWRFTSRDTTIFRVVATRDSVATIEGVRAGQAPLAAERTDAQGQLTALLLVTVR